MKKISQLLLSLSLIIFSSNTLFAQDPSVYIEATPKNANPGDEVTFTIIKKNMNGVWVQLLFDGQNVNQWQDGHKWIATPGTHVLRAYYKFGTPQQTRNQTAIVNVSGWDTKTFNHLGFLNTDAELARIKNNITDPNHPMGQAWSLLSKGTNFNYTPNPPGYLNMDIPSQKLPFDQDRRALYNFAMKWAADGDVRYADKAVEILNAWASTNKSIADTTGSVYQYLHATNTMHWWLFAAELLKYHDGGYSAWAQADIDKWDAYVRKVYVPMTMTWNGSYGGQNQPLYVALARMTLGIYLDDDVLFQFGFDHMFTEKINMNKSLSKYKALCGGYDKISLFELSIAPTGEFVEVNRDAGHYIMDISATVIMAEVLWHQGIDMYNMKLRGESTPRLYKGMEWAYKAANEGEVYATVLNTTWEGNNQKTKSKLRAKFEIAYNHYKWRLNETYPVPNLEKFTLDFRGQRGDATIVSHADLDKPDITSVSGIGDIDFAIYPNPASEVITVAGENMDKVMVFNVLGERVKSYYPSNKKQLQINLENQPIGVYFIKISSGGNQVVKQIIKN